MICPECDGQGYEPFADEEEECPNCDGTGYVVEEEED